MNKFKENWKRVDERCPTCNQVTKKAMGLNKQNLRNLFKKPTSQDVIIFIILVLCLVSVFAYKQDIEIYKQPFEDPAGFCSNYSLMQMANDWKPQENLLLDYEQEGVIVSTKL